MNFGFLKNISLEDLQNIKGLGRVKSIQIKALAEFAKRFSRPQINRRKPIDSPEKAAEFLVPELSNEPNEIIKTMILNNQNELIRIATNAIGSSNSAYIYLKDIFKEAIKSNATKIIVAHNHPSGNLKPSNDDISFTSNIEYVGKLLGIELLDHIIVGNGTFVSLKRLRKF